MTSQNRQSFNSSQLHKFIKMFINFVLWVIAHVSALWLMLMLTYILSLINIFLLLKTFHQNMPLNTHAQASRIISLHASSLTVSHGGAYSQIAMSAVPYPSAYMFCFAVCQRLICNDLNYARNASVQFRFGFKFLIIFY